MHLSIAASQAGFATIALPFLLADEAANTALAAPLIGPLGTESLPAGDLAFTVADAGRVLLAGLRRGSDAPLVVTGTPDAAAFAARALAADGAGIALVTGAEATVLAFAHAAASASGRRVEMLFRLRLLVLEALVRPIPVDGAMRLAEASDADLLADWLEAFTREALPHEPTSADKSRRSIDAAIARRRVHVWARGGRTLAMASWARPTPNGVAINGVYTPPPSRGQGIAANLVADLTSAELMKGRRFCCLYTDRDNLVSNRLYGRLGYQCRQEDVLVRIGSATA